MTHPLAALIAGVTRWTKINGQEIVGSPLLDEAEVLAALEAAPVPDLVEAGKVLEQLAPYGKNGRGKDHPQSVACRNAADTICALIALATAQAAKIAGLEAQAESWRSDYRALEKAIVGDTGLSAMTVATQARLFRPRAEAAEAERDNLSDKLELERALTDGAHRRAEAAEAEVEKLRGALQIARVHVANNAEGWSVSRGAARDDLTIVDAALTTEADNE